MSRKQEHFEGVVRTLAAAALLAALPLQRSVAIAAPRSEPALHDLRAVDDLRSVFERDAGTVRLVLLLSPT